MKVGDIGFLVNPTHIYSDPFIVRLPRKITSNTYKIAPINTVAIIAAINNINPWRSSAGDDERTWPSRTIGIEVFVICPNCAGWTFSVNITIL